MSSGSVTLNGVSDETLAIAFKFKFEQEGLFGFDPQQMKTQIIQQGQGKPIKQIYTGMAFSWTNSEGLSKVIELLQKIEKYESHRQS
jgi:hypothetical protein